MSVFTSVHRNRRAARAAVLVPAVAVLVALTGCGQDDKPVSYTGPSVPATPVTDAPTDPAVPADAATGEPADVASDSAPAPTSSADATIPGGTPTAPAPPGPGRPAPAPAQTVPTDAPQWCHDLFQAAQMAPAADRDTSAAAALLDKAAPTAPEPAQSALKAIAALMRDVDDADLRKTTQEAMVKADAQVTADCGIDFVRQ